MSVREIVVQRLTENQGADCWEKAAPKAVKDRVNQRRDKEAKNRWHVQRGANEIYYTDFGGLLLLIQRNWPDFEGLFPDQHWIANRLDDLEASGNIIAYSNQLDEREIDRVKMYLHDWIRQVG